MTRDLQLNCIDCGEDFSFTIGDQAFYREHGYTTPKRCKRCRMARRVNQESGDRPAWMQETSVTCYSCGQTTTVPFVPRENRPVFCHNCYVSRKEGGEVPPRLRACA
jgi:CxxC-x17-CxxC domain-containing protein